MSQMEPALTLWMAPGDASAAGNVHGGVVLRLIDEILSLNSRVNQAWRSSIEAEVEAWAENPVTRERRLVATVYLTMVALDEDARPAPLPKFEDGDAEVMAAADARRQQRLAER